MVTMSGQTCCERSMSPSLLGDGRTIKVVKRKCFEKCYHISPGYGIRILLVEGVPGPDDGAGARQLQLPAPRQIRGAPGQDEAQAVRPASCENT